MQNVLAIFLITISPVALWLVLASLLGDTRYEMDAPESKDTSGIHFTALQRYSFHATFAVYRQIYGAAFLASLVLFIISLCRDAGLAAVLLGGSACYSLIFVLWTAFCYESYQHQRYMIEGRSPYTGRHYALTLTLGTMSPLLFTVGIMELVVARG